jgi:hypothetical protein
MRAIFGRDQGVVRRRDGNFQENGGSRSQKISNPRPYRPTARSISSYDTEPSATN